MNLRNDFKNALQILTTTVVTAEAVKGKNATVFEAMAAASLAQRRALSEARAALTAELSVSAPESTLPYEKWCEQTLARAEALFGPAPANV